MPRRDRSPRSDAPPTTALAVEWWPLERLKPYEQNPRLNDQAVDAVAESIRRFGFRQPIVVDAAGVIIAGHTRWKAAQKLGLERVPVHVADLTPDQARAYRLADNATNQLADWDLGLLGAELKDLEAGGLDPHLLGFTDDLLDKLAAPSAPSSAARAPEPTRVELRFKPEDWNSYAATILDDVRTFAARWGCGVTIDGGAVPVAPIGRARAAKPARRKPRRP